MKKLTSSLIAGIGAGVMLLLPASGTEEGTSGTTTTGTTSGTTTGTGTMTGSTTTTTTSATGSSSTTGGSSAEVTGIAAMRDGFVMADGVIAEVKNSQIIPLKEARTLSDGTRVSVDGKITRADGSVVRLLNGQALRLDGTIVPGPGSGGDPAGGSATVGPPGSTVPGLGPGSAAGSSGGNTRTGD